MRNSFIAPISLSIVGEVARATDFILAIRVPTDQHNISHSFLGHCGGDGIKMLHLSKKVLRHSFANNNEKNTVGPKYSSLHPFFQKIGLADQKFQ